MVGPWDHEGSGEHTDHAVCVPLPPHRRAPLGRLPGVLRPLRDAGARRRAGAAGRGVHAERRRGSSSRALAAAGDRRRRRSTCVPAALLSHRRRRPADEPPDTYRLRPRRPGRRDARRQLLGAVRGARRPPRDRAAARTSSRTPTAPLARRPRADRADDRGAVRGDERASTPTSRSRVVDVFEDGTANQIQDGIVRARFRNGMDDARAGRARARSSRYELDLFATSYLVRRGHRLQVDVSSSCFDRYDRNPNTGGPLRARERAGGRPAGDPPLAGRASHVVLPGRCSRVA